MQEVERSPGDQIEPAGTLTHSLVNLPERELAPHIHPQVFVGLAGVYGTMLVVLWAFFGTDTNAALALGVCTVYFCMYFGAPFVMLRLPRNAAERPKSGTFHQFLGADVDTHTGPLSSWGAIAQIMIIPVGLTGAFVAIGLVARLSG